MRNNQLMHGQTFQEQHTAGLEIGDKQQSFDFSETEIQRVQQPLEADLNQESNVDDDLLFDAEEKESQLSFKRDEKQEYDTAEQKT